MLILFWLFLRYDVNCLTGSMLWADIYEVGATDSCPNNDWFACGVPQANQTLNYINGTVTWAGLVLHRTGASPPTAQGALVNISVRTQCYDEAVLSEPNYVILFLAVEAPPPSSVTATAITSTSVNVTWTPDPIVVQLGWLLSYQIGSVTTQIYITNTGGTSTTVSGLTTGTTYTFQMSSVSYINSTTSTSSNSVTP